MDGFSISVVTFYFAGTNIDATSCHFRVLSFVLFRAETRSLSTVPCYFLNIPGEEVIFGDENHFLVQLSINSFVVVV